MSIVVLGLNHRTSPVTVRERFAFAENEIPDALGRMRATGFVEEAVILSTCNRVEVYAAGALEPGEMETRLRAFLFSSRRFEGRLTDELYTHRETECLEHLFKVASGLDSMLLGETEILGQLKQAYDLALQHRYTGKFLNKAFQRAFNVAKQIRSSTNIQRGSVSVGSVAVELAEKIFTKLTERDVMVIGAGDTGEKTARALLSRGARSILVSNRSYEKAVALAAELGGRAVDFANWAGEFGRVDIIVSSTAAPHYVLDRKKLEPLMKLRRNRPLLLIDIAVPRDIEPEVNLMPDVYLYNIDDLQAIADQSLQQRKAEIAHCEEIIRQKTKALLEHGERGDQRASGEPAFGHEA
jgi:glutamyl-tRNA reductase